MAGDVGGVGGLLVVDFFWGGGLFCCRGEEGEIGKGSVNG